MQRIKKLQVVLAVMMLLLGLTSLNIKNVFAWHNTPVKSKTLYIGDEPVAKMGTTTQYGYIGPSGDRDPRFYSALITDGCVTMGFLWFPQRVKVEVNGTDPNGDPLSGDRFVALSVLSSPDDSGVEQQILQIIYDYLVYKVPPGLRAIVKNTISAGGATFGRDSQKAWGVWERAPLAFASEEKGLRFGYELSVDPTLEGTYTINIHYHSWICNIGADNIVRHAGFIDLYDTVTYEYVNTPNTPSVPEGATTGRVYVTYSYSTSTTDPNGDSLRYKFSWGDGTTTLTPDWYASGANASASHYWTSAGTKYVEVRAQDSTGAWSEPSCLSVYIQGSGGGGGGCPYVCVWNGTQYVIDNNILPASELSNGTDVEDWYRMEQTPVPKNGKYPLLLSEFEQEHTYVDQVKLLAVDHESDVNIAVTQDGEILTYKNPNAPLSAVDNNGTNRLNELFHMDGDVSDPATYFYGEAGDYVVLNFGKINSQDAKLILRDDMKSCVICIEVQVLDVNGVWQTVSVLSPRSYWSIEAVDLSTYVVQDQDFLVRLLWTSPHRLDYVGLDTTKQGEFEARYASLVSAVHSEWGDIKEALMHSDNVYAELLPGEQITLEFTLPPKTEDTGDFIVIVEGRYFTITP